MVSMYLVELILTHVYKCHYTDDYYPCVVVCVFMSGCTCIVRILSCATPFICLMQLLRAFQNWHRLIIAQFHKTIVIIHTVCLVIAWKSNNESDIEVMVCYQPWRRCYRYDIPWHLYSPVIFSHKRSNLRRAPCICHEVVKARAVSHVDCLQR